MIRTLLLVLLFMAVSATLSFAQSDPTLGQASTFTVLAATEIINNGETGVTGNVGVSPGNSITGEEQITIEKGRFEKGTDAAAGAHADAVGAYNSLSASMPATTLLPIIGRGVTLTPGTYKISGDLSLQGVLTLDGLNNLNSVFIIIVDGSINSNSPTAGIRLVNGAQAKNVYWVISGGVELGSVSGVQGTILAKGDIFLDAGVIVAGRVISLEGKVVLNQNNLYLPTIVQPNLSIVKTAPAGNYMIGDRITYTIVVHNAGPGTATEVVITENFPLNLRYVRGSAVYDEGVFNESNYTWRMDLLQFGESREIKLTFEIVSGGTIKNVASVDTEETDPKEDDNTDEEVIVVPELNSNLSVTKVASGAPYMIGGNVTYTITVRNAGPYGAKAVTLVEQLPAGLEFVSAQVSRGSYNKTTGLFTIGDMNLGEQATLTLVAKITGAGKILNTVVVSPGGNVPDKNPGDNTDEEEIDVPELNSNLSVTKVASGAPYTVGGNVTYTITVNNAGPYAAKAVTVTEQLPAGLAFVSATASQGTYNSATGLFTVGNLAVGSQATLTLVAKINAPGKIVNTVVVTPGGGVPDTNPGDNTDSEEIDVTCQQVAALEIAGGLSLCEGINNAVYTVTPIPNATYTFTLTGGLTKVAQAGNTITLSAGATSGTLTVTATDLCGNTYTATKNISVVNKLVNPVITGLAVVCQNSSGNTYTVPAYADGVTYTWVATGDLQITAGSNSAAVQVSAGVLGGTLTLVASNSCFTTTVATKAITTTTLPAAPTVITGNQVVCEGNEVTYSTAAIARADSYIWQVPAGWTVLSGEGTRTIRVQVGSISGNVTVAAANACGSTTAASVAVQVNTKPQAPAAITGEATVCAGSAATYSIAAVPGATTYTWALPAGWSITTGAGTAQVTVRVGQTSGNVSVTAGNACGSSAATTQAVTVNDKPATPAAITGPAAVCGAGVGNTYSIAAVAGATDYIWTVPQGWAITGGQGTTSITVTAGTAAGTVTVKAANACGESAARSFSSTINPVPVSPAAISGNATVCAGTEVTYSVAAVAGATGYTWALPTGWSIVRGEGTAQVTVQIGSASGNVSVTADNACGGSTAAVKAVTVNDKLAAPAITGERGSCIGERLTYTIPAVAGATGYVWTVPATWKLVSGQNSTSIVAEVGSGEGQVKVSVNNACGTGSPATFDVAPVLAPIATNRIVGDASVCRESQSVIYTLATVEEGVTYDWTIPQGWTLVSGNGTGTITVNATATAGTIAVVASNKCGTAQPISTEVSITVPPVTPATIHDNSNVCDGLTYSVDAAPGATGYTWSVPAGFTITSGQGTNTITVKADSPTASGDVTVVALNGACGGLAASAAMDASLADGQLAFPKAFSPNGDRTNDEWVIKNLDKFPNSEVTIFNRWGSEVYKTKNYKNDWRGNNLEQGTYFYKVRATVCDGVVKEFTGYVTLFR